MHPPAYGPDQNSVSQFWAKTLHMINGYMASLYSVRSGLFPLRMSGLKVISPIFFAYEAHECVINRRLKQITARPSHFRTV